MKGYFSTRKECPTPCQIALFIDIKLGSMYYLSCPSIYLKIYEYQENQWKFKIQTDIMKNNSNPSFSVVMDSTTLESQLNTKEENQLNPKEGNQLNTKEENQLNTKEENQFKVEIFYEEPKSYQTMKLDEFQVDFENHEISNFSIQKNMKFKRKFGLVDLWIETYEYWNRDNVLFKLSFSAFKKSSSFFFNGKISPYLKIFRRMDDSTWIPVCMTQILQDQDHADWGDLSLSVQQLCRGDYNQTLWVTCLDSNGYFSPTLLGSCYLTLNDLLQESTFVLLKNNKKMGRLMIENIQLSRMDTLQEYLRSGFPSKIVFAIDFSLQCDLDSPRQTYYIMKNECMNAIKESCDELTSIFHKRQIDEMYGFGILGSSYVRFYLNNNNDRNNDNDNDNSSDVINMYEKALSLYDSSKQSQFSPILNHINQLIELENRENYYVLVFITDGCIQDLMETKNAIVRASKLPLSIIIIGLGPSQFKAMRMLDGDNCVLWGQDDSEISKRDIVQFVSYREFACRDDPAQFRKEILRELPDQYVSYMKDLNINPTLPSTVCIH